MALPYSQYYIQDLQGMKDRNQDGKEVFGYEDVCELTALSNDFINKIVKEYTLRKYAEIS